MAQKKKLLESKYYFYEQFVDFGISEEKNI